MTSQYIVSKINSYLHDASTVLVSWLDGILPRVSKSWWQDCVMASLSYTQSEMARNKGFDKLADFDLAALLRIANKSWYDMRTVIYLPTSEREVVRDMMAVRNNWAHCSAELPGKDTIISDLHTIAAFIGQVNGSASTCRDIERFIAEIEKPDSVASEAKKAARQEKNEKGGHLPADTGVIQVNSLVYVVSHPNRTGVVRGISELDSITKYDVFVDGKSEIFFTGQIAIVEESAGHHWADLQTASSFLTAYQINNPSSQNLYSLNSARIDFVPYQFRPALKMMHADEPRILIADSVGVGKTIEAGLIIKELEARKGLERVVVICPKALVVERKWELEMKRFDEEFIPVDGPTLRQIISDTHRDGEWPLRYQKIIVPHSILRDGEVYNGENQKGSRSFGLAELDPAPHFDLVIVDEAHHIRNGSMDQEKAFLYKCTKYFCDRADAVVMLTATPLQTSDNDLFTLLNVLRPDVVIDQKTFAMMSRPNEHIFRAVRAVRKNEDGWQSGAIQALLDVRKTQWGDNVISENPLYDDILSRLEKDEISRDERVRLISDIESLHSFSTLLNRTRRRDIQDFCVRRSHTVPTQFTPHQQELHDELLAFERAALSVLHDSRSVPFMMSTTKRQAASCIFGLAPHIRAMIDRRMKQINDDPYIEDDVLKLDEKSADALSALAGKVLDLADNLPEDDPKFDEVLKVIQSKNGMPNNKIMLFSTFRHTLFYVKAKLVRKGYRAEQVDGSVEPKRRYELKTRFELPKEDPDAIDILLFTEVGSEGLDYQFCDFMINYDLPWNPMMIEQRIGRIDRRGQMSEAVHIYNAITENTVDADIYYRCLLRIGIFEKSIGECDTILGKIAADIESISLDNTLSDEERNAKLEQIADNEVRKIQELNRLEEEEKELFGFDLTEFTTAQEIRNAENPWLTQQCLQKMIEQYLKKTLGGGGYIIGDSLLKNLRLSASARGKLKDAFRKMPGARNALRREWENYLSGKNPNHAITFDPETASKNRDSFFITAMHPLAKQAAEYFAAREAAHIKLSYRSDSIPKGIYPFSIYAWKYSGFNDHTRLVTICENDTVSKELPTILEQSSGTESEAADNCDWAILEGKHVRMWMDARDTYKRDVSATLNFKLESLANNQRNRVRSLEQKIQDSLDESIRRMYMGELEKAKDSYDGKVGEISGQASRADIYATLLVNGVLVVKGD